MDFLRIRAPRWIAAGLVLLLAVLVGRSPSVGAGTSSLDVGDQAVVNLIVRGRANDVAVRVWDRPSVQVEYSDENVSVEHRVTAFALSRGLVLQIPPQLVPERGPDGMPIGATALPPEEFPYASFRPGRHDVVAIDAPQGSHLTVTVPATTGILAVRVGGGRTTIENYHGANLVVIQNQGRVQLTGSTTTAFVQMNYGAFYAADDTFERIRVRGVAAHDVFERCRSKEIDTTSVTGAIVYDGGAFDPGLARFETATGQIALGVTSGAQLTGRTAEGHVYTLFDRRGTPVEQHGDGDTTAIVGGGGPLVSAISQRGNVYLYDGSLVGRRITSPEWRQLHALFNAHRAAASAPGAARPRPPARSRTISF
ncbi:MAG TPA: hypothetical protein VHT53_02400 [Candidatus Elarobacter sp.]|nr:hypothetical protein [Candidatus Elarobacter sp.]